MCTESGQELLPRFRRVRAPEPARRESADVSMYYLLCLCLCLSVLPMSTDGLAPPPHERVCPGPLDAGNSALCQTPGVLQLAAASLAASLCQQFAIGTLWADSASSIISSTEADPHAIRRTPRRTDLTCEAQRFQSNQPFESAPIYFRGYTWRTSDLPS